MTTATSSPRKRLSPDERKRQLLDKAVEFFAEEGFEGGTRQLAQSMGVTQPLLFRYFASKDDLINAVYERVYLSQWNPQWARAIRDSALSLQDRLESFYASFSSAFDRTWMRIFFFAALNDLEIHRHYLMRVTRALLLPICEERRRTLGIETALPVTEMEHALVWTMHGAIFHQGIREHIYGLPPATSADLGYRLAIRMYLEDTALHIAPEIARIEASGEAVHFDPLVWKHLLA
ncbi:TetR/AcrR family transcriptional regulator [Ruixingdingia sedimenti]|uniref:TetR/AcrR family transcriptional regulator n=1 Tax=Ruixingdingia sedimenti TaxID=3073604 RepID=A0ABU1FDP1_9RHOB|nr:TetR/AcrR family transcriptional regulator [Xinfangfangia sp. LG-4]MDR5654673.1 TetR/AcrR family transcriptional regulator [Xinfangfangia sp. LG-4]